MILQDSEAVVLKLVALGLVAALLLVVADTPLYPLALGVVLIALVYILLSGGGAGVLTEVTGWINSMIGG